MNESDWLIWLFMALGGVITAGVASLRNRPVFTWGMLGALSPWVALIALILLHRLPARRLSAGLSRRMG